MPTRSRSHILEDLAQAALLQAIAKMGWTVEPLSSDYGEDFLVRIFDNGRTTPFSMYIQSKATDDLARNISKDRGTLHFSIETRHLRHWERFWEPVVLAVFDATSKKTYWRVVQPWLEQLTEGRRQRLDSAKTTRVPIPIENCLNAAGLKRLGSYTEHRFKRFEREQVGANHLIECLKEAINLELSYDAQNGILIIPNGSFQLSEGGARCYFFGKTGSQLSEMARLTGKSEEHTLRDAIEVFKSAVRSMSRRDIAKLKTKLSTKDDA